MVQLKMKLSEFTEQDWKSVFGAYVKVNNSHWTGPPYSVVQKILEEKGVYEFGFEAMGTWASKFRLENKEGDLHVFFVKNEDLPARMKSHLDKMEQSFVRDLENM